MASAWTNTSNTFASIAATPSPTFQTPESSSPTEEQPQVSAATTTSSSSAMPSPLMPLPSDEDMPLSPAQLRSPGSDEGMKKVEEVVDMNSEFPPLTANTPTSASTPHTRSQSDPLLSSLPAKLPPGPAPSPSALSSTSQASQEGGMVALSSSGGSGSHSPKPTQPHPHASVTSSWPLPTSSSHAHLKLSSSVDQSVTLKDATPTSVQLPPSEKLPFVTSPKSPDTAPELDEGEEGMEGHAPSSRSGGSSAVSGRSSEGDVSSLAVGTRPPIPIKSVAVIQPTQQVHMCV